MNREQKPYTERMGQEERNKSPTVYRRECKEKKGNKYVDEREEKKGKVSSIQRGM